MTANITKSVSTGDYNWDYASSKFVFFTFFQSHNQYNVQNTLILKKFQIKLLRLRINKIWKYIFLSSSTVFLNNNNIFIPFWFYNGLFRYDRIAINC